MTFVSRKCLQNTKLTTYCEITLEIYYFFLLGPLNDHLAIYALIYSLLALLSVLLQLIIPG